MGSRAPLLGPLCGALLLWWALAAAADDLVDFDNPVRSAEDDEMHSLPGLNYSLNFKHYSGYVAADDKANRFWHYWFVESQDKPDRDPVILWLNGGPGCSSMLGLMTELGPYSIDPADGATFRANPHAWNRRANVVFFESPAGVGFSYARDGSLEADDDSTAKQNHQALRNFFQKFPKLANRELYLTGESYGGVYLPTLAVLVDADPTLNLKGVAIGNGYLDANKLAESLVYFSYYHGLVGKTTWDSLSSQCCQGKPPARGQCKITDPNRSEGCATAVRQASDDILNSGLNPYNLYDKCAQPASEPLKLAGQQAARSGPTRESVSKSLLAQAFNATGASFRRSNSALAKVRPQLLRVLRDDPPCTDDSVTINYLNRPEVKRAIHIPEKLTQLFSTCSDIHYTMIYPASRDGLAPQMRKLLASPRNLNLLVYNGDTDMMCNFFGDEWFVDDLKRRLLADYAPWHLNGQVAGFVKHYDGITYMTVKGSGHMVPTDKPAEAYKMIDTFLYGHHSQ